MIVLLGILGLAEDVRAHLHTTRSKKRKFNALLLAACKTRRRKVQGCKRRTRARRSRAASTSARVALESEGCALLPSPFRGARDTHSIRLMAY